MKHSAWFPALTTLLATLLAAVLATPAAQACRCAQRTLPDYYAAADEVFVARLEATEIEGERRIFTFAAHEPRLKTPAGPERRYASPLSSAACAVAAQPGATYVVFAEHDAENDVAWLTSCGGTRLHRATGGESYGFEDVPARFVVALPVRVLESQRLASSLWFLVQILASSPCDVGEIRVVLEGWVPAYGAGGEPAVWYYSRGC